MSTTITKRFILPLFVAIFSFGISYANPNDSIRIELKPIITEGPTKPQAPSIIQLSAYAVESGVVVMSNVDVMAEVKIYDEERGQSYYNATVALAPECHCPLPQVDAVLTLRIIIDDRTYKGTFKR